MNISNVSVNTNPAQIDSGDSAQQVQTSQSTQSASTNLTVSVNIDVSGPDGTAHTISLEVPSVQLGKMNLSELEQLLQSQLSTLNDSALEAFSNVSSASSLSASVAVVAEALVQGGVAFAQGNQQQVVDTLTTVEEQATVTMASLSKLIDSGAYPDQIDFLKLMLAAALDMKEFASEAKQAAVQGQFDQMIDMAATMRDQAEKTYAAGLAELKKDNMNAFISIGSGLVGAALIGRLGVDVGVSISRLTDAVMQGTGKLAANASYGMDALEARKEADMLGAAMKLMEASQKMEQAREETMSEIRDSARALVDFLLKMIQDFNAQQNQIVQRANV